MTTTLSLSLKKCLVDPDGTLARIETLVDATSWCLPRISMFANAVVLRMLDYNAGTEPCRQ